MLKNVIVINDFDYVQGGASKVALQTANLLKENYPELNVYFFSGCHNDSSILNKDVISICTNQDEALKDKNKLRGTINGLYNFKAKKELKNLLKSLDKNETIIHIHGWTKLLSSSVFDIAFKMKFKVVLTLHDYFTACPNGGYFNYKKNKICHLKPMSAKCRRCNCDSRNYGFKLYRVLRQFIQNNIVKLNDKLEYAISISEFSEKILKGTLNKNTKIFKIYNPIDFDEDTEEVDYRKNKYYLYVGRVSKEKGVNIFCEAITKAKLNGIVVGDGNQKNKLENKFPNIRFIGWKNSHEVRNYIIKAKALIVPSLWYEGASLTTLEALQYGIPAVVSDYCAASEFVQNGINGYKFQIGNIDDLIKKIKLIDNIKFNNDMNEKILMKNRYEKEIIKYYHTIIS